LVASSPRLIAFIVPANLTAILFLSARHLVAIVNATRWRNVRSIALRWISIDRLVDPGYRAMPFANDRTQERWASGLPPGPAPDQRASGSSKDGSQHRAVVLAQLRATHR
jgi:hypothetical protein